MHDAAVMPVIRDTDVSSAWKGRCCSRSLTCRGAYRRVATVAHVHSLYVCVTYARCTCTYTYSCPDRYLSAMLHLLASNADILAVL
jgi:hypothetical protein